jgi:hypothetical protein
MTISLVHPFASAKADGPDATKIQPSNWNAEHTMTMATNMLLGRATALAGAVEEITLGTNLSFTGTTLNSAATIGLHSFFVPANRMTARTTNGAAAGSAETTTNKIMLSTLDFDATTQEFAQFCVRMPKKWNEATVTAVFTWSHAATAVNFGVQWAIEAVALSNDDAADTAFGTARTADDTGGTTDDIYMSPETSAITIAGTPAAEDYVVFQVKRVPANAADTLAVDARLHGVTIYYTTHADTDA